MNPPAWAVDTLVEQLAVVAKRSERSALKERFMAEFRLSASSLSRLLIRSGIRAHARNDKGVPRKRLAGEAIETMLAIQCASRSLRKGDIAPARRVIEIAELNGIVEPGEISADYLNRYMREQGLSRSQRRRPEPHITMRSIGPNHVHGVDFSLATNWVLTKNGIKYDRWAEDPTKLASPRDGEMRMWRMLVTDHATGCFFPFYGAQHGESVQMLLRGLYYAWSEKALHGKSVVRQYPFRGVPRILVFDRGSSTKSKIVRGMLTRMGVQLIEAQRERAKGFVERTMWIAETDFDAFMRLQKPESVEQFQEWALDWTMGYCARITHRRTGMSRTDAWVRLINREEETRLRELRCDLDTWLAIAISDPESRIVRPGGTFSFKTRDYRVPRELLYEQKIWVQYSPVEFPAVQIRASEDPEAPAWLCEPIQKDHLGFDTAAPVWGQEYKSHHKSEAIKAVGREGTAVKKAGDLADAQTIKVYGYEIERTPAAIVNPRGEEFPVTPAPVRYRTRAQAREEICQALGLLNPTPAEREVLAALPEQVTEAMIDQTIEQLRAGVGARVVRFAAHA
jgi:hypothetical protein